MVSDFPSLKYGHTEGQTRVCYDDSGEYLVSCGHDGEVRIWKGTHDDEPHTVTAGEKAYSISLQGSTLYVASDNNSVDRYTFPDANRDGVLLHFTGNPTCVCISESKKLVAAGSSDFDIKVICLDTKKQKFYLGHQAPILCVALDPNDEFLASTSCDGSFKIWDVQSEKCTKSIDVIPKSNDICNSPTLAGLSWRPATGEDIAVAVVDGVNVYSRVTWSLFHSFKTIVPTKAFQSCNFSPCGRFMAASSVDGWLVLWDAETQECLRTLQHPFKSFICSVVWDPRENNSLSFSDARGQIGTLNDAIASEVPTKDKDLNDLDALFEEEDDNMMIDMMAAEEKPEAEAELPSLKKRGKSQVIQSDDEDDVASKASNGIPPIPSTLEVLAGTDDIDDLISPSVPPDDERISLPPPSQHYSIASMQPPFQSGSTPTHLSHRFMVWNSIGVVRAYNDETENAIDVEFHDVRTHHAIHISNMDNFTMADLSDQAVVLACESSDESASKLKCVHFASWDTNKEWTINMPQNEEIQAVTIGDCWLALCTDALQVRLLSLGGVQRQIFSIPGQVVTMAAHTDQLIIVYHVTQGYGRNQCLGCILLEVGAGSGCKPRNIIGGLPFPVSPGSTLVWLGFTAEGTPASVDSSGIVRLVNRKFCNTWNQVADVKKLTKSRHDHHWVVGLHENPQQIRCILCKGCTYPATLPRPTLTLLNYTLPLCGMENEKSKYEEEFWRTKLFSSYGEYLTLRGYEPDPMAKKKFQLEIQQNLMRLFALCCRSDNDFQAYEVSSMMPTAASVNLAIKYASRLRKIMLAQRLQEVAQEKLAEEAAKEIHYISEEEEKEEDFRTEMQAGYSTTETEWSSRPIIQKHVDIEEAVDDEPMTSSANQNDATKSKPTRSLSSQLAGTRRNPFKVPVESNSSTPSDGSVLDGIKRSTPTSQTRRNQVLEEKKKAKTKEAKKQRVTQTTLQMNHLTSTPKQKKGRAEKEVLKEKSTNNDKTASQSGLTGVMLYIDENLSMIQADNPDVNGVEARKIAIKLFRSLGAEEKQKWNERAKSGIAIASMVEKRERDVTSDDDHDDVVENIPPPSGGESADHDEVPSKKQKLCVDVASNDDDFIVATPAPELNTKSKLSAFKYSATE